MAVAKFRLPASWPAPADAGAADRLLERFTDLGRAEAKMAARTAPAAMLRCLGGNSPYLSDLAIREAAALRRLVLEGPDAVVAAAMAELATLRPDARRDHTAAALRRAKRVVALATAVADIGGIWTLEQVTGALSALAETTLTCAVSHLLRAAHDTGELRLSNPDNPSPGSGFTALGMGKLGARELNYSSDVDLVLLYDPAAPIYTDRTAGAAMGGFTSRIARGLISLMEARDADGYVFRTDLRLRPDPAATPPAIALPAAIIYYESMGQNWERAAMIKARPVAGDRALGHTFLNEIRPFVWRRGLDFAAVADIHAMKQRIDQHRGTALTQSSDPVTRIAGHNVKLGEGGIREIEFLVQTLQLVWGGRDPALREAATLGAMQRLTEAGRIPRPATTELEEAYRFLRQVEHRLQMVADRQTHEIPEKPQDLARISTFLGYPSSAAFADALLQRLDHVRRRYAEVFEHVPDPPDTVPETMLDLSGDDPEPAAAIASLRKLGYREPARVVAAARRWQAGHVRALRSMRARELMSVMLPIILQQLATQPAPDTAFSRFDRFLSALPAGVQLLSLFQRNPSLLQRIGTVLGAAPSLADHLARDPHALEGLLSPEEGGAAVRLLHARLRDARLLEDVIELTRRAVKEEDFYLSVATLDGRLDADAAGERRSMMADAAMEALLAPVLADFETRFGSVNRGAIAVVAMGKAGGQELMAGSDLDLMLIYDHPRTVVASKGARSMPASQWFVRAAHAYVAALTAPGAEGAMYAVDMRLRPSGNKGPVAVSLSSFVRYHGESAWTWERMALTRARVVAGPPALRKKVESAIRGAIAAARDPEKLRADATAMRLRMLRDLPPDGPWDMKLRAGGQIEVEFVAQTLQLIHAAKHPKACHPTTRIALGRLAKAGLLPDADAALLIHADHVWRTIQGMLRITVGHHPQDLLPEATSLLLLRAAAKAGIEAVDLPALRGRLDALARDVRAVFDRHVGEISHEPKGR
jgi:[glutamine synthetase] adenylyltransferase / [glutamine synthetase]-adenylyl-L-tyrosine phosphorylase